MTNHTEDYDMLSPNNKANFDEGLESIVKKVLQLPLDNPIPLAINEAGATTWHQFMYMDEDDIYEKNLTKYEQKLLSWFIGYVRESIDANAPGSDQPSFYTKEGFTKYTQDRRKIHRLKSRYGASRMERDGEQDSRRKSLEDHVVDLAAKVKKTTTDILDQLKERKQKEKAPAAPQDETDNEAAEVKQ